MDRVSILPNEVLCHILSFLTTKEAALTSILSKRWRNLLAFVPNLDIDASVFLNPEECKEDKDLFMDFVDRILALQGHSPIKKFSLKLITDFTSHRFDGWINNALARGVSELDLSIVLYMEDCFLLSSKCFKSRNLVTMKLNSLCIDWFAGDVFLPMLKTLVLHSVRLHVDRFFFRALPALEELVLVAISWRDRDVTVSSASLKRLTMKVNYYLGTLEFDTPCLVYFCYSEFAVKDYPVVKMENLVEASISLLVTEDQIEQARAANEDLVEDGEDDVVLRLANVGKLMNGIRNVQYLDLSANTLEVLSLCCESMPVFNNLKSLSIKSNESRGWQAVPVLIRNCPHLENLGLLHYVTDKCGDACDCVFHDNKGRSLTSCPVKMLEIKGFQGTMKEMHIIEHFLNYFPCLKEIKIHMEEFDPTQLRVPEVSEVIAEIMGHYNKSLSCSVQLLVSGDLYKKWTAQ